MIEKDNKGLPSQNVSEVKTDDIQWNDAQLKIIDFRSGNMIVSASAGSGKTTVMLERVMRLIEEGTPIERIVILAFNNAIASEIRTKLYNKLYKKIESGKAENVQFLCEQLDNINLANIVTNDAYCNHTVKEFFEVLGVDPDIDILAEKEKDILFAKCYDTAVDNIIADDGAWVYDLIGKFGSRDKLKEIISKIHTFSATVPNSNEWLGNVVSAVYNKPFEQSKAVEYLLDLVRERVEPAVYGIAELIKALENTGIKMDFYHDMLTFFKSVYNATNYNELYTLVGSYSFHKKFISKSSIPLDYDYLNSLHYEAKEIHDWLGKVIYLSPSAANEVHAQTSRDVSGLMDVYNATNDLYKAEKLRTNKFEFSDLMQYTLELLKDEKIANEISARYDYICVDEYQDTNYAQEQMFNSISNGDNLFMVGDSKQSIYKFRLTEPKILLDKYEAYENGTEKGETVHLDYNYRSNKKIVEFVNKIFNVIMTKTFGGVDYVKTDQLKYGADYKDTDSMPPYSIDFFVNEKADTDEVYISEEVYSVKNDNSCEKASGKGYQEGKFIARQIKRMVGSARIYDIEKKCERVVGYDDIVLLAKSSGEKVKEIIKALQEEQIPVNIAPLVKANEIYEVNIIKQFITVLSNDRDDMALSAVLTSYWVGMDMQELYDIRHSHKGEEYFYQACLLSKNDNVKLSKFYDMVSELRLKSSYMSLCDLASLIVYGYGYDKHLLSLEGGAYKLSAVKTYLASLGALGSSISIHEYVDNLSEEKFETQSQGNNGCVQAMTIHKSKGLEFPIVFLCDVTDTLYKEIGMLTPKMQLDKEMGIAINYFDEDNRLALDNIVFRIFTQKKIFDTKAEAMRLFYVALTRAKNHIFITGTVNNEKMEKKSIFKVNSFKDWICNVACVDESVNSIINIHQTEAETHDIMERYTFRPYEGEPIREIDRYLDFKYPYEENTKVCIKYTVTEINNIDSYEDKIEKESITTEHEYATVNRAQRGTDYHAILEHIDYAVESVDDVSAQLIIMAQQGVITEDSLKTIKAEEIYRVVTSPIIRLAMQGKYYREQEFMLCVKASEVLNTAVEDKILVQGAVDLIIDGEELLVVDFKKSSAPIDVIRKRYKKQLELYSLAVSEALGRPVDKAIIYVIGRDEIIEF